VFAFNRSDEKGFAVWRNAVSNQLESHAMKITASIGRAGTDARDCSEVRCPLACYEATIPVARVSLDVATQRNLLAAKNNMKRAMNILGMQKLMQGMRA